MISELQAPSAPKYDVYISESKVNMLYAQRGRGTDARPDSIGNLDAILADLARVGRIGTIDEPNEYLAGAMPMCWGRAHSRMFLKLTPSPLVYFGGVIGIPVVGLGGSAKQVIGRGWGCHAWATFVLATFHISIAEGTA